MKNSIHFNDREEMKRILDLGKMISDRKSYAYCVMRHENVWEWECYSCKTIHQTKVRKGAWRIFRDCHCGLKVKVESSADQQDKRALLEVYPYSSAIQVMPIVIYCWNFKTKGDWFHQAKKKNINNPNQLSIT